MTITRNTAAIAREVCSIDPCNIVVESSSAGLAPGEWPRFARVEGEPQTFCFVHFDYTEGMDVAGAWYGCADGSKQLLIIND